MLALAPAEAELGRGGRAVGEEPRPEGGIAPRPRDDPRAVARPDLRLVGLDDEVERGRIDIALFDQHGFERADAQRRLGEFRAVVVIVVVVVVLHGAMMPRRDPAGNV